MVGTAECELHHSAILIGPDESEAWVRLAQSPIGDECRHCQVCRAARTYVARRLDERSGRVLPPGENGEMAWRDLQLAVTEAKAAFHRPE